jgi:nitroreductase
MHFLDLVRRRESIRSYDPEHAVEEAVLHRVLEAGRLAPSAANRQPWEFILVRSPEALARVRPCYDRPWFHDAPLILAVAGWRDRAWVRPGDGYNTLETDLAIAMDHLILAAEAEGLATCWIAHFEPGPLREALGLGEGQEVFALTPLGYPRGGFVRKGAKTRKLLHEILREI